MLVEPTNDTDTDMLAAIEDLLDTWAGTLIVVSHDRYFLERVTDQQYAILDGRLRHLPGGIDEYLALRAEQPNSDAPEEAAVLGKSQAVPATPALSGAERRAAEKELQAAERRITKLQAQVAVVRIGLADFDQSDYELLGQEMANIAATDDEIAELEERWLELSEILS